MGGTNEAEILLASGSGADSETNIGGPSWTNNKYTVTGWL
jgi:hypothetical protein